ncbi:baseplate J/gp47 family protein, partial [Candidatus Gottesmanbacteria bacterium]|nr:baseplate J/gp47 family protein [Candidatus Gottesmanbacteria bacterium]
LAPPPQPVPRVVSAEEIGFQKEDILEKHQQKIEKEMEEEEEETVERPARKFSLPIKLPALPKVSLPHFVLPKLPIQRNGIAIGLGIVGLLIIFLAFWTLHNATVTILANPQTIQKTATVTLDPTATVADSQTSIIPGHKQEKSLSGNKTIPVTGTKLVGDPAKGSVTIYNKSFSPQTFSKGTVFSASGLSFTLDSDATVASASENLVSGTVTFGKITDTVTAADIGPNGNLPAGTEFTFANVGSDMAVARNDAAFTGGTSRNVTVVSRSDYDALVQGLTNDLLNKAKGDLTTSISGGEKLIDQTITTGVTNKTFSQELGQESQMLSGSITVDVTGTSYNNSDLAVLFRQMSAGSLQPGYTVATERTETTVQNVQIKKDGTIVLAVTLKGIALPAIDLAAIRKDIAGKSLGKAQEYLKRVSGIGGAEFRFRWNILPNRLPWNSNNISVSVAVQQ